MQFLQQNAYNKIYHITITAVMLSKIENQYYITTVYFTVSQ